MKQIHTTAFSLSGVGQVSRSLTNINSSACSIFIIKPGSLKAILKGKQLNITIQRLCHQMLEKHGDMANTVLIGIQTGGVYLADKMVEHLMIEHLNKINYGKLDITFYRDDLRKELHVANNTDIPFSIEDKNVILIDDVLYTGRTIRAALDALQDFGRPKKVELCVLIDRKDSRQLPIQPDYCGMSVDSEISQRVKVAWESEEVILL